MQKYLDAFHQMVSLRGLTGGTLKSYTSYLKTYLNYLETQLHKLPEEVTWEELRSYILFIQSQRNLTDRTINAHISQLRFFTLYVLHKPWDPYQLPTRKFDIYLPAILSQEEVLHFIDTLPNLKHKALVATMYSAGLRVGEVCHLKYSDISRKKMSINVAPGKNRSQRYAILAENTLDILTQYWQAYDKPEDWLFPSTYGNGRSIVPFTANRFVNDHLTRLGWSQEINCHSFRHSFGTHLYENGVDLMDIKNLLGHKSLNSTTIYVHLASHKNSSVKSPFDCQRGTHHG